MGAHAQACVRGRSSEPLVRLQARRLHSSCLTPHQNRKQRKDRADSQALLGPPQDLIETTFIFCAGFGFCQVTMGLCCSEKQKKNFEILTSWKKVS